LPGLLIFSLASSNNSYTQGITTSVSNVEVSKPPITASAIGEQLDDMAAALGGFDALLDLKGRAAVARGLAHMDYDTREELLADPALLRAPLVRAGKGKAAAGADEKAWGEFAKADPRS